MLLTLTMSALAQVTTSSMAGKVTLEGSDEEVIGATIVAMHEPSGTRYTAVTNVNGLFTIQGMRPGGPYAVTVSYVGFQTKTFRGITLQLAETYNLPVWLSENATDLAEVVISGKASKLMQVKMGAATNITAAQITALPTVSRSITDLTRLSPYGGNGMTFAGSDGRTSNFTIDGGNFNNDFGLSDGLPGGGNPVSIESIEEMQVVIAPYDVRQTNFIGGGVNAITKSGTNTFKGSAYIYHRNENMRGDAVNRDAINGAREKDQQTTYGLTLGGPIIKDKLFFFVNGEMVKTPTVANRWQGSDSDNPANAENYISRTTKADLQTVSDYVRQKYGYNTGSYTSFPADENNYKLLARLDWNITDRHHLSLRYNYTKNTRWSAPNRTSMDGGTRMAGDRMGQFSMSFANSMYSQDNLIHGLSLDLNSRLTESLSNQFLATFTKKDDIRGTNSSEFPFIDILDGADAPNNYMSLGYELFTWHNAVHNTVWNIKDDVTYYTGNHKVTAGLSFEHQMDDNMYMRNGSGYYRYYSLQDFLTGATPEIVALTYGYDGETEPAARVQYNKISLYGQDDWTLSNKFKLSFGVRLDELMFNNGDLITNNAIKALDYSGRHIDTGKWPKNQLIISPRIGFTYNIFGDNSLKLRGGTGLFAGRIPMVFFTNMPTNGGLVQYQAALNAKTKVWDGNTNAPVKGFENYTGTYTTDNKGNRYFDMNQFAGDLYTTAAALQQKLASLGFPTHVTSDMGTVPTGGISATDAKFKMPQVWKSSLALDYNIPVSFPFTATIEGIFAKTINDVCITDWSIPSVGGFTRFNGVDNRPIYPAGYRTNTKAFILDNTSKGYQWSANITLNAQPAEWISLMAAYTHTAKKEITGMPGSAAESAFTYVPTVEGPNNIRLHNAQNLTPDRFVANATINDKCGNSYSLIYETWRGGYNYSYMMVNDINGDGYNYDAVYVPTDQQVADGQFRFVSTDDAVRFLDFVHNDSYLKNRQGKYTEAYSVYNPWVHRIDFSYKHDFCLNLGNTSHDLQLSLDVKNVLNLFNSSWGVTKYLNPAIGSEARILKYEGVDADGYATFSTPNSISGQTETFIPYKSLGQCWYASIGVKYMFEGRKKDNCGCSSDVKEVEKTVYVKDTKEIDRLNGEINRLRGQVADLEKRQPETKVITNTQTVTFPYLVNFQIGNTDVVNREKVNLETVAQMIKATPEKKYSVYGYADKQTGSAERNAQLAKDRSLNVYDILTKQYGVPASQLVRDSKGGVDVMYLDDPQLSRSVIISEMK